MNDNFSDLKDSEKQGKPSSDLIVGAVIILVGGVLLLRNLTGFEFNNWWILFSLIPLSGMLTALWKGYQANGRLATGPFIGALGMVFVISIFLFNLSWSAMWPGFFIIGGISVLLGSRK
jgi:hypothetical protein